MSDALDIRWLRNVANAGRGSVMTSALHAAADEIERLTSAAQHEADCVEAYRAQVEMAIRERDELRRQLDEARAERDALANVLPGVYYMDPPDGGDVPVLEQLRRMAKDAERYRWLRDTGAAFTVRAVGDAGDECSVVAIDRPALGLDAAIDAAMRAGNE